MNSKRKIRARALSVWLSKFREKDTVTSDFDPITQYFSSWRYGISQLFFELSPAYFKVNKALLIGAPKKSLLKHENKRQIELESLSFSFLISSFYALILA